MTTASIRSTTVPDPAAASPIAATSRSAVSRNNWTKSSALDGKWRYSAPAETPARPAIAVTDAAA